MADRLFTSRPAEEVLSLLRLETKIDFYIWARIAFALSLQKYGASIEPVYEFTGKQFKRAQFIGQEELYYRTLLSFTYKKQEFTDDEFYSNSSAIKYHIDHGCKLLKEMYDSSGQDKSVFLSKLSSMATSLLPGGPKTKDLELFIGKKDLTNEEIIIELNNTVKYANSHLAITGKPGTGKTQFLLKLLTDIRHQSNFLTNFILFDYKGDVSSNDNFVNISRSTVYTLPDTSLPLNPFILPAYDESSILISAREKSESFASINSKLGPVQKGNLTSAMQMAYNTRQLQGLQYPDFEDVYKIAPENYDATGQRNDTLIEILRDLWPASIYFGSTQ